MPRDSRAAFPVRDDELRSIGADAWLRRSPDRIGRLVREAQRFTSDLQAVAQAAIELADALGIDEQLVETIVTDALRHREADHDVI